MGKSVVVKKDQKVRKIYTEFGLGISLDEFKNIFKERYPREWQNINSVYEAHERNQNPGKKKHPMPHPEKYLENTFNFYKKKLEQENDS